MNDIVFDEVTSSEIAGKRLRILLGYVASTASPRAPVPGVNVSKIDGTAVALDVTVIG